MNKQEIVQSFRRSPTDTGSPEVQVAIITKRIEAITQHLEAHRKDNATRRGLLKLVGKRRSLLKYLADESPGRYQALIGALELRK